MWRYRGANVSGSLAYSTFCNVICHPLATASGGLVAGVHRDMRLLLTTVELSVRSINLHFPMQIQTGPDRPITTSHHNQILYHDTIQTQKRGPKNAV